MKLTVLEMILYGAILLFTIAAVINSTGLYEIEFMNNFNEWQKSPATNGTVLIFLIYSIFIRKG